MKENPYSTLIQLMQEHGTKYNPPSIQIGEIVSSPPNIIIKIGELQIDKDNILIADYLLSNYNRQFFLEEATLTGSTTSVNVGDYGSHLHNIDTLVIQGTIKMLNTLKQGDIVAVMPTEDRQTYIILAKLVKLNG